MRRTRSAILSGLIVSAITLSAPALADPPPHAPAHGYRHQHAQGVELSFDAGSGVYLIIGMPNHFFHAGKFYRLAAGRWQVSASIHGGSWTASLASSLPTGLRSHEAGTHGGKHPGPAKRGHGKKQKAKH